MKLKLYLKLIGWLSAAWLLMIPVVGFTQNQIEIDVLGAEGQEAETDSFKVSYSVGEPRVFTLNGGGFTLTEGFIQPDLFALYSGMPGDSVWPGDANHDLVADMYDLLAIGIAYNKTGPNRINASNNWVGQFAANWNDSLSSGVNHKHVDCNGDGVVNQNDTLAINLNYGLIHNKNTITEETNGPLLYTKIENTSLTSGDTAIISINFGTDTATVDNLYGIAFSLELDTSLVKINTMKIDFGTSWLGDKSQNMITLVKPFFNGNQVDIALTRIDLLNQTGHGRLAQMIIMIDDLSGKNEVEETFKIEVKNVRAITCHQNLVDYSLGSDSLLITDDPNSIENTDWEGLEIYPNPAREKTQISLTHTKQTTVKLTDMNGKMIWLSDEFRSELIIPTAKIASGVYLLQIATEDSQTTRKLVVKH